MRTTASTAMAAVLLALTFAAAPASADSGTAAPTASPRSTPAACPLDAKSAAKAASLIAEVVVRHEATTAADGSTTLGIRVEKVLKGTMAAGPATLVVTGSGCALSVVRAARAKDALLVLGTSHGTQVRIVGSMPTALVADQACQIEKVLGKACEEASTGVVFTDLSPAAPTKWLRIAAPGLAAIIVAVLGLFLLRLRRR